jgi:ABC-type amino acid transport system permease subunit
MAAAGAAAAGDADRVAAVRLTSLITLHDLTFEAQSINAVLFRTGPILGIILVAYACGSRLIDAGIDRLEHLLGGWRQR